ncbi:transcriptional repressor LexA [Lactobacillus kefiranofaciens]|uniref:LexA repressor n=1 Tax=Lactobacillus kefiranofaciens TaxID=267818 RepID=A0AAX3UGB6_9LACO|nr:transcriptional repressor LexA [Lactobacillus kefiranofaciens]AEG40118.1 LexA repressor [Lactobacillus kefiranofaciens subsp. kefiranofaciens]KRM23153.1 LexA repressor [Lactobacillus kefiranofaciens subsp. kefiranofaciens DSM 5016 = JCM 6985]MDH5099679.1 transcriptional repressor LexA [Lactobacillus kefiranofaciens]QFQ67698.1 transcriptional repressor LexA [Lactobacillus kefiranofaciens subsp. kefiranofaciens]WGO86544.1 transcriptional repressor LexA [Lactobacillus kefiranofaciens]
MPKKTSETKQLEILQYIYDTVDHRGFPPTVREICAAVGLSSTSTVHGHLSRLERKGLLIKDATKPRALEITAEGKKELGIKPTTIPIVGVVAAGQPILAVEDIEDYFPLPPDLKNDAGELFMLKIHGNSMINAGILNGDSVIVKKQSTANNGEIVVAMTEENEATIKRFFKENGHYRLQPENDSMSPIILSEVKILGKVVSLYRNNID